MSVPLEQFLWERPVGGFEWVQTEASPKFQRLGPFDEAERRFLVRRKTDEPGYFRFNPLTMYPTLFRVFAETEPTEAAFASFADKYGDLGVGLFLKLKGGTHPLPLPSGEPLYRWRDQHKKIGEVVELLDMIAAEDRSALAARFSVGKNHVNYNYGDPSGAKGGATVAVAGELKEWLWDWATKAKTEREMLVRFAKGWVQKQINDGVSGKDRGASESFTAARVLLNHETETMTLHVVPSTLLAALWLQCARVLTVNPTFKSCQHCKTWFELSPDARRRHTIYCTDRCKVAAYRAKVAKQQKTNRKKPPAGRGVRPVE